jgi:GT2 family glycosyltransferase
VSAIVAQEHQPFAVSIHINSASEETARHLDGSLRSILSSARLDVSWASTNDGFSAPHNRALRRFFVGGFDYALVVNPDLALACAALGEMLEADRHADGPTLWGPLCLLADPATGRGEGAIDSAGIIWTRSGRHLDAMQGRPVASTRIDQAQRSVAGLTGACLLVSRRAWSVVDEVSGEFFDEDFIAYREDAELGYRAALLGVESRLVPDAVALHARRLRGTSRHLSDHVNLLGVRNRFLIAAKYGRQRPGGPVAPWLRDIVVLVAVLLRERTSWPGILDAWRLREHMRAKGRRVFASGSERALS